MKKKNSTNNSLINYKFYKKGQIEATNICTLHISIIGHR